MKNQFLIVTAIFAITGALTTNHADACALRLPNFELAGFPISRHQVAVLGSGQVEERAVTPTLMLAGMPASPHQIAVLTRRAKKVKIADASADSGLLTVEFAKPSSQRSTGQALCASE